jgi:uncharacterized RDD family membrane protein YckC
MTPVGFWTRLMAYNIDFLFYLGFALIFRLIFQTPSPMYFCLGSSIFLFEIGFLLSPWAATPGRKKMNITIVDMQGNKLKPAKLILRTFAKVVSLLLLFMGFAIIAFREDKRGLHDMIAGSSVVHKMK